jgi:acyl carrier protein
MESVIAGGTAAVVRVYCAPAEETMTDVATHARIKQIIIEQLNLDGMSEDDIGDGDPLFGEGLGLDSVDALELVVALEKEYGVKIEGEDATREAFTSVTTLTEFVNRLRDTSAAT